MINQFFINSIISASVFLLVAISFSVIFQTTRFFHFAHGTIITVGTYSYFLFFKILYLPIGLSFLFAISAATFLGCAIEVFVYCRIKKFFDSNLTLLIASLGVYFFIQNLISLFFGDDTKSIRSQVVKEGFDFFYAKITATQILIIIISLTLFLILLFWIKISKQGKILRAVTSNENLVNGFGLNSQKYILLSYAIGSLLAGISGILISYDVDMTPTMGMSALFIGVVTMVVGGIGSFLGLICSALLLGFAKNFGVWYLSSQWQDTIIFLIMLIFLLFRPQGFFGKPLKKAEI